MPLLFGAKLRYLRQQRNLTQVELSSYLHLASHGHITNVETGRRVASIDLLLRIANFFEVTIDYLLRDEIGTEVIVLTRVNYAVSQGHQVSLFGEKLHYLRTQAHLSQTQLTHRLSLASRAYISNLEADRKKPSLDLVVQIADLFGTTTDYLLRDTIPVK